MNMQFKTISLLAVTMLTGSAAITWTGATNLDPFDDSNWDFTGSAVAAVDSNVSINDDINITGGNLEIPNLTGQVRLQIGNGFTMTLDNSILGLVSGGNDGVGGEPLGTGVNVNLLNGSQLNVFFIVNGVSLDIDSTSSATLGGGGIPINLSTVNLTEGAVLAFLAETPEAFVAEHLSKVTVDGAPAVEGSNILIESFNGASGSRVSVISVPEPTSGLLATLGASFLLFRRRK